MLQTPTTVQAQPLALPPPSGDPAPDLELVELELSLDGVAADEDGFSDAVRRAAGALRPDRCRDDP